jgi:hypothetical protein
MKDKLPTLNHIQNITLLIRSDGLAVTINEVSDAVSRGKIFIAVLEKIFRGDVVVLEC